MTRPRLLVERVECPRNLPPCWRVRLLSAHDRELMQSGLYARRGDAVRAAWAVRETLVDLGVPEVQS